MRLLLAFLMASLLIISCKKTDVPEDNNPITPEPKGTITGTVVTPNNKTVVRNANVFIMKGGVVYNTVTDVNGKFSLQAPAGQQTLHIQSGTGKIFRTQMDVTITENQTTAVNNNIQLSQVANLAYVWGNYDAIEQILMDSLGYNATVINYNNLHVLNDIAQYNAIFINCKSSIVPDWLQDSVLATYVANGGSLYVSDWAVNNLIGQEGPSCPNPRMGGFIPDSKLCTQRIGQSGFVTNANIVSPVLQTYLNKNTMNVKYDLGTWEMVMNYDTAFWEVMVKHPLNGSPLMMRTANFTNSSAGTVNIGGSSNTNFVTVCHKPQGSSPITITIPAYDLQFHLGHGDSVGSCSSTNGAGRIYFTTFHNEPNGIISPDMKHILDFIILNL